MDSAYPAFLRLPQEIRDRIYYYAYRNVYIIVSSEPEQTYSTSWDNFEQFRQPTRPSKQGRNPTPRLQEVCRQLYRETRLMNLRHGTCVFYDSVEFKLFIDALDNERRSALTRIAFHHSLFNHEIVRVQHDVKSIQEVITHPMFGELTDPQRHENTTLLPNLKTILVLSRVRAALTLIQPCPPPCSSRVLLFLVTDEAVKRAYDGVLPKTRVRPSDRIYIHAQMLVRNHSVFYLQLKERLGDRVNVVMREV